MEPIGSQGDVVAILPEKSDFANERNANLDKVNDNTQDETGDADDEDEDNLSLEKITTEGYGTESNMEDINGLSENEKTPVAAENGVLDMEAKVLASFGSVNDSTMSDLKNMIARNESNVQRLSPKPREILDKPSKVSNVETSNLQKENLANRKGNGPKEIRGAPGLPIRQPDVYRDSSSSERELDTTDLDMTMTSLKSTTNGQSRKTKLPVTRIENEKLDEHIAQAVQNLSTDAPYTGRQSAEKSPPPPSLNMLMENARKEAQQAQNVEVENEYDYVKYARVQNGDIVGMRLACSESEDALVNNQGTNPTENSFKDDIHFPTSSRECTPDKYRNSQQSRKEPVNLTKVNDDLLTEISLNSSDRLSVERKNVSLSPENTECDSTEIDSVISEEGRSGVGSSMPNVEDGLSSNQCSDTEDIPTTDSSRKVAEFLSDNIEKQKQADNSMKTAGSLGDANVRDFFNRNESSRDASPMKQQQIEERKKALDLAIKDIQSALQKKKNTVLHSPITSDKQEEDPVWIMRDSYVKKIQREDEFRFAKEEAERKREEKFLNEEQEKVYQVDNEDEKLMKYQFTRNEGKSYQAPKGYDSDDQYPENQLHEPGAPRRGRGYRGLPVEDPLVPGGRSNNPSPGTSHRVYGPSAMFKKSSSQGDLHIHQRSPGYKPQYNNFSNTLSHSRYRNDTANLEHSQSQGDLNNGSGALNSDRDRILQSYGYNTPQYVTNSAGIPSHLQPHQSSQNSLHSQYDNVTNTDIPEEHVPGCPLHRDNIHKHEPRQHYHSNPQLAASHQHGHHQKSTSQHQSTEQRHHISTNEVQRSQSQSEVREYRDDPYMDEEYNEGQPSVYIKEKGPGEYDTDEETDELLHKQYQKRDKPVEIPELGDSTSANNNKSPAQADAARKSRVREVTLRHPDDDTVLIEGVLFRARYLGSTTLISEGTPSKSMRMMQAQEAVGRIKAPEGENQPSTDVDLFVSTEKIMVLNTNLQEILMDHSLRTISYIADIGDVVVIMARRGPVQCPPDSMGRQKRQSKICCHVFETEEAQLIAQSIGQAFQVAYMEFLKANGIEDQGLIKEMDYQEVLNQQEIFGEELYLFSNKETQREVIVPKIKGEPLNIVIVESGWGSMVPTVVLANMSANGAAARCGQLNIGDQIMSVNGVSLVGLPLSSCQNYIKAVKTQTVVKLNVVSCPPVVEVCIKRPDVKYQLGFSVQNGVICSLLRGGIAERGGVRVGHRIIEINNQSVVAVAHEKIVTMLATAVGEIHMKTMPTSIFRLLTGQETPHYI